MDGPTPRAIDTTAPRIFLRPVGSPLTVGMSGLAIASFIDSGLGLAWLTKSQALYVGLILVAVPFVLQLLACVFSYLARDGAAGAALGLLSCTWLALGLIYIVSGKAHPNSALGLLLLVAGGALALSGAAVAIAKPLPGLIFLATALRFVLAGIYQLSATQTWNRASGILGLVIVALAGYAVLAFELEGQQHRPVLPTFRRRQGAAAIAADIGAQLDGVVHEAGVRQTT
jgi:succinate-acetate transporter protein